MIRSLVLPFLAIPVVAAIATAQRADSSTRVAVTMVADTAGNTITGVMASEPGSDAGAAADSLFLRAQRMVAHGQGDAGRALVQAQLDSAAVGSPAYVKALYWHAIVAPTAAAAEHDLRRIVIEYSLSPESADALLRLAQLEMARGDTQLALEHLDRLLLEHPANPSAGRAGFWMGRLLFKSERPAAACARLAQAERATDPSDVELLNQIAYYQQRCVGVDTSLAHADRTRGPQQPATAPTSTAPATPAVLPRSAPPATAAAPVRQQKPASRRASPPPATARQTALVVPSASRTTNTSGTTNTARTTSADRTANAARTTSTAHDTSTGRYTIQIAAYNTKSLADKLRAGLASKGLDAFVNAGGRYYRVCVGHYATRRQAADAAATLRTRHIDGFVTETKRP